MKCGCFFFENLKLDMEANDRDACFNSLIDACITLLSCIIIQYYLLDVRCKLYVLVHLGQCGITLF